MKRTSHLSVYIALVLLVIAGCATTRKYYYNAWEKFGYDKRERLVDNVKEARDEQAEAKKEFASALEEFKSVVAECAGVRNRQITASHVPVRGDRQCGAVRPATINRILIGTCALCDPVHRQPGISNGKEFVSGGAQDRLFQGSPTASPVFLLHT